MTKVFSQVANQNAYPFMLPELPYSDSDFGKYLSAETFDYHHKKHHKTYVDNLNKLLETSELKDSSLEDIIKKASKDPSLVGVFNNAAQVWNHSFYWHSMKPRGGGMPSGNLGTRIQQDFGSFENFAKEFKNTGAAQFGSGWVWLVIENQKLKIIKTSNANVPITDNILPLITCDVWEHAYYIDYRNKRVDYLTIFLEHLVNWDFASDNLSNS